MVSKQKPLVTAAGRCEGRKTDHSGRAIIFTNTASLIDVQALKLATRFGLGIDHARAVAELHFGGGRA